MPRPASFAQKALKLPTGALISININGGREERRLHCARLQRRARALTRRLIVSAAPPIGRRRHPCLISTSGEILVFVIRDRLQRRARSLTRCLVVSAAPPIGRRFRKLAHFLERLQSYGVCLLRQYSTGSAMLALPSSPSCVRLHDLRHLRSQIALSSYAPAGIDPLSPLQAVATCSFSVCARLNRSAQPPAGGRNLRFRHLRPPETTKSRLLPAVKLG